MHLATAVSSMLHMACCLTSRHQLHAGHAAQLNAKRQHAAYAAELFRYLACTRVNMFAAADSALTPARTWYISSQLYVPLFLVKQMLTGPRQIDWSRMTCAAPLRGCQSSPPHLQHQPCKYLKKAQSDQAR